MARSKAAGRDWLERVDCGQQAPNDEKSTSGTGGGMSGLAALTDRLHHNNDVKCDSGVRYRLVHETARSSGDPKTPG